MESNNDENQNPVIKNDKLSAKEFDSIKGDQKLSLINRKFLRGQAFEPPPNRDNFLGFRPQLFFFYGSLMDSQQLRKVLQLQEIPVLQPASIVGFETMLWGQYPALVFKVNNITYGIAYEVQKEEHIEYLKHYETQAYKVKGCKITLADGRELPGKTFIWNGGKEQLKEGAFDLKDWQTN